VSNLLIFRSAKVAESVGRPSRSRPSILSRDRRLGSAYVFLNPQTGEPWVDVRKQFVNAWKAAGLSGVWFHDLRRSFVTNARRYGVSESVVMRMSGHKTRRVRALQRRRRGGLRDAVEESRARGYVKKPSKFHRRSPKAQEPLGTAERA